MADKPRMALFTQTGILPMDAATVWAAALDHLDGWEWGAPFEVEIINTDADQTSITRARLYCENRFTWDGWTGRPDRYAGPPKLPPQPKRRGRGFTKAPHKRRH